MSLSRRGAGVTVAIENARVGSCDVGRDEGQSNNCEWQKVEPERDVEAPEALVEEVEDSVAAGAALVEVDVDVGRNINFFL